MTRTAAAAAALLLGACAAPAGDGPLPGAAALIARADWGELATAKLIMIEYAFAPAELVFREGAAYQLVISNTGNHEHHFRAPRFFDAVAVRSLTTVPLERPDWADEAAWPRPTALAYRAGEGALRITFKTAPLTGEGGDAGEGAANPFAAPADDEDDGGAAVAAEEDETIEVTEAAEQDDTIEAKTPAGAAEDAGEEIVALTIPRGAIVVPARRTKRLEFVAVRTGTYELSGGGLDPIWGMRGRIIIE